MPSTTLDGIKISYEVRESEEASVPRIDFNKGRIKVVVPTKEERDPEAMLKEKKSWVLKQKREFNQFKNRLPGRKFLAGETIELLGTEREIKVEQRRTNTLGDDITLAEHLVENTSVKDQLEKLLREEARDIIEEKVEEYKDSVKPDFNKMYVRDQDTRWGSCTDKDNLNFNWRLILGPEHVLEYVVVHELVHLEEKNHDEDFWERVAEIYPDYRESNQWLAENSHQLVFDPDRI